MSDPDPVTLERSDGTTTPPPTERLRKGRTLAERRAERRDALLAAALELFGTKGYAATSVEEICRTAYVSTRNFYEEFDNREAVLVEISIRVVDKATDAMLNATFEPGPDRVRREATARVRALAEVLLGDPRLARIAFIESLGVSPDQEARRREVHRMFALYLGSLINADFEAGRFLDRREEVFAVAMVGAINELFSDFVLRPDKPTIEDLVESIVGIIELMSQSVRRDRADEVD